MASAGTSTAAAALLLPLLVLVLFAFAAGGARADGGGAIEFSPPRARRAGPVPVDGVVARAEKASCPLVRVPSLVDACRSAPGLSGCAAQCVVYRYRGGYCDMLPNGRPGDCYCTNCLATQA